MSAAVTRRTEPWLETKPPGCRFCDRILPAFLSTLLLGLGLGSDRPGEGGPQGDPRSARLPTRLPAHACALRGESEMMLSKVSSERMRKSVIMFQRKKKSLHFNCISHSFHTALWREPAWRILAGPRAGWGGRCWGLGDTACSLPTLHSPSPAMCGLHPPYACHLDRNLKI